MRMLFTSSARAPAFMGACGIVLAVAVSACISGCATKVPEAQSTADASGTATQGVQTIKENRFLGIFSPYRIDIQQGNFISSETMAQLRDGMKRPEGMTRDQVRFLLGTPLITDAFHGDRWDYVFRLQRGNGEVITSHLTVTFNGNKLDTLDGTLLPTEKDYISLIAGKTAPK
ncbi:MAG TPA: outer membrane protein assembly factor BamE [Burkholderiaceae bacterium]|jgi:outer membrane protein assembly factor BamE|nr:outer membrane protein assembly factor BamE [Burkholderiaceae bacterium]